MLTLWGLPVAEVVRELATKGTYRGEVGDDVDDTDEGEEVEGADKVDESNVYTGNGTTDSVISAG